MSLLSTKLSNRSIPVYWIRLIFNCQLVEGGTLLVKKKKIVAVEGNLLGV